MSKYIAVAFGALVGGFAGLGVAWVLLEVLRAMGVLI